MKAVLREMKRKLGRLHPGRSLYVALIIVGLFLIGFAAHELIDAHREYASAREEYQSLREEFPVVTVRPSNVQIPQVNTEAESQASVTNVAAAVRPSPGLVHAPEEVYEDPMIGLLEINSDFVGWMIIDGIIDYPVVRGRNNSRYLNVTFRGQYNASGAIFMDYRNTLGFDEPVAIIYGHNMRDDSMFAPLHQFRNADFMAENQYITIYTPEWELLQYRVFAARITDAWDQIHQLGFRDGAEAARAIRGAPEGARRFLVLSTCTNSADDDERLLIYAALIEN